MSEKDVKIPVPKTTVYESKGGDVKCTASGTLNASHPSKSSGQVSCTWTPPNGAGGSNYSSNKFRPR